MAKNALCGGEEGAWDLTGRGSLPGVAQGHSGKAVGNETRANTAPARAPGRSPPLRAPLHPPVGQHPPCGHGHAAAAASKAKHEPHPSVGITPLPPPRVLVRSLGPGQEPLAGDEGCTGGFVPPTGQRCFCQARDEKEAVVQMLRNNEEFSPKPPPGSGWVWTRRSRDQGKADVQGEGAAPGALRGDCTFAHTRAPSRLHALPPSRTAHQDARKHFLCNAPARF